MGAEVKSSELAKEIVIMYVVKKDDPINITLTFIKNEIRELF